MTVVATRTSRSPSAKARMTRVLGPRPASGRAARHAQSRRSGPLLQRRGDVEDRPAAGLRRPLGAARPSAGSSSGLGPRPPIREHTTKACAPAATSSPDPVPGALEPAGLVTPRARRGSRSASGPPGSSASVDVSRSPNTVIATVRGIGVAVMTRTCGRPSGAFSREGVPLLDAEPVLLVDDDSPRSGNGTCSSSSACVPTTMPASPVNTSVSADRRAADPLEPVSRATRVPARHRPACRPARAARAWPEIDR